MNKLFTKIVGAALGLTMAIGVGVGLGHSGVRQAKAAETVSDTPISTMAEGKYLVTTSLGNPGVEYYLNFNSGLSSNHIPLTALGSTNKNTLTTSFVQVGSVIKNTKQCWTISFVNGGVDTYLGWSSGTNFATTTTKPTDANAGYLWTAESGFIFRNVTDANRTFRANGTSDIRPYSGTSNGQTANLKFYPLENSIKVTSMSIDQENLTLDSKNKDYTQTLTATIAYSGGTGTGVTWTSSNTNSVVINSTTGVVTLRSNGVSTITAKTNERSSTTNLQLTDTITITVTNFVADKGDFGNPYTVAEAKTLIDNAGGGNTASVHVSGIISKVDSYQSNTITYWISDDGTTTNQLEVYKGKGLNGANFSAKSDLSEGQLVIVSGTMTLYNSSVYEFNSNSQIAAFIEVIPTKTLISWNSEKGTYYNGTIQNTYRFSTSHITVKTADANNYIKDTYSAGTGFIAKIYKNNTLVETLDASSSAQNYDFKNQEATSGSVAWTIKATVGELAESVAMTINVIDRAPTSFEWTTSRTATLFAHKDTFNPNEGVLKINFNDTGSATSWSNYNYSIHTYDENAYNHLGSVTTIPTHTNGTINLSSETKYVLNYWHKSYESGLHCYFVVTVKIPTLHISDNYTGDYYVGVNRNLDVTVTPYYGEEAGTALSSSEYVLKVNSSVVTSLTPENTDAISVYAAWVIDESEVLTTAEPLSITPIESSRVLGDMTIDNQTFTAGSFFILAANSILVEVNDDAEYLDQGDVTFETEGGVILTSNTRLLKSYTGTITASYAEGTGEGKETQTTFALTVNDPVISSYTEPVIAEHASQTTSVSVGDVVYLVSTEDKVQFSGMSSSGTSRGLGTSYSTYLDNNVGKFEIVAGSETNTYAFKFYGETKYLSYTGSSNSLSTDTTIVKTSSWTITFNSGNAVIKNANSTTRQIYWNSDRFACYTNSQTAVQLFKRAVTPGSGDAVEYLKSVIDYYRLKAEVKIEGEGLSVCSAGNSIFGTSEWTKAKSVFSSLTTNQRNELSVQDYFGEEGKTYVQTYEWLISKDPANQNSKTSLQSLSKDNASLIIVVISMVSITAVGAFLFLRKRKEQ